MIKTPPNDHFARAVHGIWWAVLILPLSGCMTGAVIHDGRFPKKSDSASWANYLLLPLTIPADIATSPIQFVAFVSYARGERPYGPIVPISQASGTNAPLAREALLSPKARGDHD